MTLDLWQQAASWLEQGSGLVLLVVVESEGSAPGKMGFKMLVNADGGRLGTIGGGIMERKLAEQAQQLAATAADSLPTLVKQVHRDSGPASLRSGMICAGYQTIALVPMAPAQAGQLHRLLRLQERGKARLDISPTGWSVYECHELGPEYTWSQDQAEWLWRERPGLRHTVYVIGGGHVGLALCRVLALTDFHVVNIDHRGDVDTFVANDAADEKQVCAYEEMVPYFGDRERAYAVVVTTSFATDVAALRVLASIKPFFVGLMGSTAKIKRIFGELAAEGVTSEWLGSIAAPVGVGIKNSTPVEIAISIAAQLIHVRAEVSG